MCMAVYDIIYHTAAASTNNFVHTQQLRTYDMPSISFTTIEYATSYSGIIHKFSETSVSFVGGCLGEKVNTRLHLSLPVSGTASSTT